MKIFFLISFLGNLANAKSLDEHFALQTQETISPVLIHGKSVVGGSDPKLHGASVCAAIGFIRLVQVEVEPCEFKEPMVSLKINGTVVSSHDTLCASGHKLKSVTCAR